MAFLYPVHLMMTRRLQLLLFCHMVMALTTQEVWRKTCFPMFSIRMKQPMENGRLQMSMEVPFPINP